MLEIKSIIKRILISSFIISVYSCKKENNLSIAVIKPIKTNNPIDYRDTICGNYFGTKNINSWIMGGPINDTTFAYNFTVIKHASKDSLIVDGVTYPFDTSLSFYSMPYPGQITSVDFYKDSCKIFRRSGGLGGSSSTTIKGKRN